jgi:hypothetical protein
LAGQLRQPLSQTAIRFAASFRNKAKADAVAAHGIEAVVGSLDNAPLASSCASNALSFKRVNGTCGLWFS